MLLKHLLQTCCNNNTCLLLQQQQHCCNILYAPFDKSRLSMRNVRWSIGGVVYDELTPELYARLCAEGGYALLRPPPSKVDPFSLHWGPCTIYLRFSATEVINAARELAREEIWRRVPLSERESAPLFVKADGGAWRHAELAKTFDDIMVAVRGPARAAQVSMHSWRVYLACALLSKGASFATIQTMLRWRSEDALRIYARINNFAYADWLTSAQGASVSSVRTTTAGPPPPPPSLARLPAPCGRPPPCKQPQRPLARRRPASSTSGDVGPRKLSTSPCARRTLKRRSRNTTHTIASLPSATRWARSSWPRNGLTRRRGSEASLTIPSF